MRRPTFSPRPSDSAAASANPVVQLARLAPQSEFARAYVAIDALGGGANAREFVVVNGAGAVHGDVIDQAAFHQIDDVPVDARAQHMRAHHEDPRRAGGFRGSQARGNDGQVRMLERRGGVVEREPAVQVQIVLTLGERLDQQARAVELFISAHDWQTASAAGPAGKGSWG